MRQQLAILLLLTSSLCSTTPAKSQPFEYHCSDIDGTGIETLYERDIENLRHWGFIDKTGAYVIPAKFEDADSFSNGFARVKEDGKSFMIDHSGKTATNAPKKKRIDEFAKIDYSKDIFDATGTKLISQGAKEIIVYPFSEGLAAFRIPLHLMLKEYPQFVPNSAWDKSAPEPKLYEHGDGFGQCGYIDENGRIVIPPQFNHAYPFHDGLAKFEKSMKRGYIDKSGNVLGGRYFSEREDFSEDYAAVKDQSGWGFIDRDGRQLVSGFDCAYSFSHGVAAVQQKNGKWGFIDKTLRFVIEPKFDKVQCPGFDEGLALVRLGDLEGFLDTSGNFAVPPRFIDGHTFSEELAAVAVRPTDQEKLKLITANSHWKCGFIDKTGTLAIDSHYTDARPFSEGLACVREGLRWGFIDTSGKRVIEPKFDAAYSFSDGLAAVFVSGKWGYIDKQGKFAISPTIEGPDEEKQYFRKQVSDFSNGRSSVKSKQYSWYFIDKTGTPNPPLPDKTDRSFEMKFSDGAALVHLKSGDNWEGSGFIDTRGKITCQGYASWSHPFSEGLAAVGIVDSELRKRMESIQKSGKFTPEDRRLCPEMGFIDKTGQVVIKPEYTDAGLFRGGLAPVAKGERLFGGELAGKWGFVNRTGKLIVPLRYDEAEEFSEGLAAIKDGTKWGYINQSGNIAIEPRFESVRPFRDGLAAVKENNKWGYIDKTGRLQISARFWLSGSFIDERALIVIPNEPDATMCTDKIGHGLPHLPKMVKQDL